MTMLSLHIDGYRGGTRHRPHRHDELHFSLVLSGHVMETVGSVTEHAGPLAVVAKDSGVVHANEFGAGAKLARLSVKSGTIGGLIGDASRGVSWRWTHDVAVARPFVRLVGRARGASTIVADDDPDLIDLLVRFTARPAPVAHGTPPAWIADVVSRLRAEWRPSIRVADLAREAGVHPVYLARAIRRWYGTGVAEELRRARLRAAVATITRARDPIAKIAHEHGFADEAHLCRSIRASVGLSPGRYRSLLERLSFQWRGRTPMVSGIQAVGARDAHPLR
jgi:AraC family transcriptional regulator